MKVGDLVALRKKNIYANLENNIGIIKKINYDLDTEQPCLYAIYFIDIQDIRACLPSELRRV